MRWLADLKLAYWNVRHWDAAFAWTLLRTLRLRSVFACVWLFPIRQPGRPAETVLSLRAGSDLTLRTYSTDPDVFRQVFLETQYELPPPAAGVSRIVDAGANIGLSSLYFLLRYPDATIVGLEPDPENHRFAVRNTRAFGDRCRIVQAALWTDESPLSLVRGDAAWSTRVEVATDAVGHVIGMSLDDVLKSMGWQAADIVKLDIEGAELQVLTRQLTEPTPVACWAIELHSDEARQAFRALFDGVEWRVQQHGEIDLAWRVKAG